MRPSQEERLRGRKTETEPHQWAKGIFTATQLRLHHITTASEWKVILGHVTVQRWRNKPKTVTRRLTAPTYNRGNTAAYLKCSSSAYLQLTGYKPARKIQSDVNKNADRQRWRSRNCPMGKPSCSFQPIAGARRVTLFTWRHTSDLVMLLPFD